MIGEWQGLHVDDNASVYAALRARFGGPLWLRYHTPAARVWARPQQIQCTRGCSLWRPASFAVAAGGRGGLGPSRPSGNPTPVHERWGVLPPRPLAPIYLVAREPHPRAESSFGTQ